MSNEILDEMLKYAETAMEASGTSGDRIPFWRPKKDGKFTIRILPAKGDMKYFLVRTGNHWTKAQGGNALRCPKITHEQQCLVCAFNDAIGVDKELRKKYNTRVQPRFYMNILVCDDDYYESDTPYKNAEQVIWDCAPTAAQLLFDLLKNPDYNEDIADWEKGVELILTRETENGFPTYKSLTGRRESRSLKDEKQFKAWEENRYDLAKFVEKVATPAEMVREFNLISLATTLGIPEDQINKFRDLALQEVDQEEAPPKPEPKAEKKQAEKNSEEEKEDSAESVVKALETDSKQAVDLGDFNLNI